MMRKEVRECFKNARSDEKKGKKHKGLMIGKPDANLAREYLAKAKRNLEFCDLCLKNRFEYKIQEEWFYTLYYCALAVLSTFGVETRSQRCTAAFLRYVKGEGLIDFEDDIIERITVHRELEGRSDVDERETARYGSSMRNHEVISQYERMTIICKNAISQTEEIVYSDKAFVVPKELIS